MLKNKSVRPVMMLLELFKQKLMLITACSDSKAPRTFQKEFIWYFL